jgi:RND family efflux transporter MFP subunit
VSTNEDTNILKKTIGSGKRFLTLVLLVAALGVVALIASHRLSWPASAAQAENSDRRPLYWYDAMNPQHHYDKAGKAPDGMDLVPMFAQQKTGANAPAAPATAPRTILYWYDPMHPKYTSDKPGVAPDCGMVLVPKYADDQSSNQVTEGAVTITGDKQILAGVRTAVVERRPLVREIRTTAQIVADESRIAHVHVKTAGFIEHVYVDYIGQLVKKGQPLFTQYSPDLVSTEEEYLIAKRGNATLASAPFAEISQGAQSLLESTRQRMKLWDISDEQIRELDETGKITRDVTFYSPVTGFVTDRKAFPQTSITPDTELYTVSDMSSVWANADIYEYEVPFVRLGQRVSFTLSYYPGKSYSGVISFIYPTVDPQTRTVKVRVQLANPGFVLKPNMFADAELRVDYGSQILVPQEAVLDSGTDQRVYIVRPGGVFEPRKVTIGPVIDGNAAVLSGLKAGETIVVSGNFLVDSESRLKGQTQH